MNDLCVRCGSDSRFCGSVEAVADAAPRSNLPWLNFRIGVVSHFLYSHATDRPAQPALPKDRRMTADLELWRISELSLIQLFKTEQILAESVCLSVCPSVCPRTRQCIGSIKNWHSYSSSSNSSTGSMDRVSAAAAAAVWWWEITASHCRMVQTAACCIVCRFLCVSPESLPVYRVAQKNGATLLHSF